MTTKHPSPLVAGTYVTFDSPMTWILWVAALAQPYQQTHRQSKGIRNGSQHKKEQDHDHSMNNTPADISMNGQK